jgi:hypothetical protein
MMTMLQVHADALNNVCIAYHEFLLHYKVNAKIVYGIVEGKEDPMFYRGLIERQLPNEWDIVLIPAGCKDNVLRSINAFNWDRFPSKRICFFVDRDLSDFIADGELSAENLYITDNYSIESDAINFGVLKRLLIEIFNITDLNPAELTIIEQRFSSALTLFKQSMLPVMAQIILWRRDGKRPSLNDIQPKNYFIFKNGGIKLKTEFELALSRLQHVANSVNLQLSQQNELSTAEAEFCLKQGVEKFIRGKYMLWFLVEFATEVHRSVSLLFSRFVESPKVRISIGQKNAMVVLAPRVRCPESLNSFLEKTYGEYIRGVLNSNTPA